MCPGLDEGEHLGIVIRAIAIVIVQDCIREHLCIVIIDVTITSPTYLTGCFFLTGTPLKSLSMENLG